MPMLAYVFWHSPAAGASRAEYEHALGRFHAALAAAPPAGFRGSAAHAVTGADWVEGEAYEDWYLVERWDDLGALNDAAVDAGRRVAHDTAARIAADGAAGVYRLRSGADSVPRDGHALWMHKPRGVPYDDFRARLAPLASDGGGVWERQMLLGPAPEYCVLAPRVANPTATATLVGRRPVYP